jgi:hypothetical protein
VYATARLGELDSGWCVGDGRGRCPTQASGIARLADTDIQGYSFLRLPRVPPQQRTTPLETP